MNTPHRADVEEGAAHQTLVAVDTVDTRFLETLFGYNARRAALVIIERFLQEMAPFDLRPVDFSVLSLVQHNPGITSRQLCTALGLLPPNLVGMLNKLEKRNLIHRLPHPSDRRAMGLHMSAAGQEFMMQAESAATELEREAVAGLTATEQKTLLRLLQKIYR
jgi:DNA-binding MarR family transcriptional regulator